jgi:hypothetical protein
MLVCYAAHQKYAAQTSALWLCGALTKKITVYLSSLRFKYVVI